MNIIKKAAKEEGWSVDLGECARIWKGGCIIRAKLLDRIKGAYDRNPELPNLLVDSEFSKDINANQASWRRVVSLCVACGIPCPAMSGSLNYLDTYRRDRLPANLVAAQRDFFGAHGYERADKEGRDHTEWGK
ncbi:G6PGH1 [Symbiodinium sp. KB8]|nr:G6PGH1 [Symbiodinium sp. KB8]